jgi:hypothetical protein
LSGGKQRDTQSNQKYDGSFLHCEVSLSTQLIAESIKMLG